MNRDRRFEDVLDECIGLVAEGRRTIEGCLALYPQWAERLEPLLRLAAGLTDAYAAEPSSAYEAGARQRFLAAARERRPAPAPRRRAFPAIRWPLALPQGVPRPALAAVAVAVLALFVFPSFLLATSGDALPGDWRYPVKRLTERTRLTFTFGDDARRGYRISLAEERLHEVQELAGQERRISESVLNQLVDSTEPLVQALEPNSVPTDQIERITDLTAQQQDVLGSVDLLVEDNAVEELEEAMVVSSEGHDRALLALALATAPGQLAGAGGTATPQAQPSATAAEGTPEAGGSVTPTPTGGASPAATETTPAGPTPESTPAPEASPPPGTEEATATPEPTAVPVTRSVTPLLEDSTGGLNWSLVTIGDFSVRTPNHLENGWVVSSLSPGEQGETLFIGHRLAAVFDLAVVIRIADGEASVYAFVNGSSQRVQVAEVAGMAPPLPELVFHILESVSLGPP